MRYSHKLLLPGPLADVFTHLKEEGEREGEGEKRKEKEGEIINNIHSVLFLIPDQSNSNNIFSQRHPSLHTSDHQIFFF